MREMKFRAWVGKMEYDIVVGTFGVFFVNKGPDGKGLDSKDSASLTPFNTKLDGAVVMQYTGMKDKNGKEIYEGDVVRFIDYDEKPYSGEETYRQSGVGEVKFGHTANHDASGYTDGWFIDSDEGYFGIHVREIQVIGNIYENPELVTNP